MTDVRPILDDALRALSAPDRAADAVPAVLPALVAALQERKDAATPEEWARIEAACLRHPLRRRLHEDPLAARAFHKPRGYAGDAGIIDLIYRHPWTVPLVEGATPFGRALYDFLCEGPIPRAIRDRRRLTADAIDAAAARVADPAVLSVACGHLREAELSVALAEGRVGRMVALDQDADSLAEVAQRYGALGVERVQAKVEAFLDGLPPVDGEFDLVYSTGLYDYLDASVGPRLTAALFDLLRPGGRVFVANLLRDGGEVAYTEAFMDWHVVYRDEGELRALAALIPADQVAAVRVVDEPARRVAFVEIEKR